MQTNSEELWLMAILFLVLFLVFGLEKNLRAENQKDGRKQARRRLPPKELLFKEPEGICFGTVKKGLRKYYVCRGLKNMEGSCLVSGSSGAGKSSSLYAGILLNQKNYEKMEFLVLDMKKELTMQYIHQDCICTPDNPEGKFLIFEPSDRRNGWGYDAFYGISLCSTESEVFVWMDTVSQSLCPIQSANSDNNVWILSSQQMLRGLLTYFYFEKHIRTLPQIIKEILSKPIKDIINEVIVTCSPTSKAVQNLIAYKDMADETLLSVFMNLSQKITPIASLPDLEWALGTNPRKCCPNDLLNHSIMLCVSPGEAQNYATIIQLIISQYCKWLATIPEKAEAPDRKHICLMFDEFSAFMNLAHNNFPELQNSLRLSMRSKNASLIVATQSIPALETEMSHEQTNDFLSNLVFKCILDCIDSDSAELIGNMAGKFLKRKVSQTEKKYTVSYEEANIENEESLSTLTKDKQLLLVTAKYGTFRVNKAFCFKDKFFKKLLTEVKKSKEK